ncbi:MmgE/PrpD family protein [Streptomyces sp. NBC_00201]|uniref:MmgE/PrpD family protein n=1 Tax=unclassified Streptomyces TaxID=2593676 RepID=UPI002252A09C|nr:MULTISPECIES: MmgE/PrpD family protein [unclassified Streptomyces]MCX5063384.1 MmgE/PrpD family protein [Streptomyces sp. NBC_00452]MCX5251237.1 MmgE/PrpD family protein [Streptomyces sp. NBC_00201]MCX5294840.1 MmgE/PrpD family protein [Streptomyces sp. NBC_00183]
MTAALALAQWASEYRATPDDVALAERALADTVAVALAARTHPLRTVIAPLPDAARWAAMAHVLDFDDLHTDTTTHISVVTVPAVLAVGGDARAYLAGAGVMARLGAMLGWGHYAAGWHATCSAGAPAAAVAAGLALGLDTAGLATAIALAVPAAGGGQEAFGTHGKSLQVGFAADAGVRAARLARAGATADPRVLDAWLKRVGGTPATDLPAAPAVPGGLAVKLFPCCYAMQRPIAALREVRDRMRGEGRPGLGGEVTAVGVSTPAGTVHPLIHDRPATGLEGKFSLPYAVAAALLDDYPGFDSFTDDAVRRPAARALVDRVRTDLLPGETGSLLDGHVALRIDLADGRQVRTELALPPGAPGRPLSEADLRAKAAACGPDVPALLDGLTWAGAAELLRKHFPYEDQEA